MPYRPEADLKRPDLKGEFLCGHCGKTFCHAASLNRHRLNFHGDDQHCQLCDVKIPPHETVRRHMSVHHAISRVFTCGCCNWTFPDKKELHAHNNSMMRTGQPGEAKAIAVSSRPPGSLSQAELRGEDRVSPSSKFQTKTPQKKNGSNITEMFYNQLVNVAQNTSTNSPQLSAEWLSALLINNPSILPLFQQSLVAQEGEDSIELNRTQSVASTSCLDSVAINNNNEEEFDELKVKTETISSGESGIASGEEITDSSPTPSPKEGSPDVREQALLNQQIQRKRKSVDAIASLLFKKKCLME